MNYHEEYEGEDFDELGVDEKPKEKSNAIRNTAAIVAAAVAMAIGIPVAHEYPEAKAVSDLNDDVKVLGDDIKTEVLPAAKNAANNPHELAVLLREKRMQLEGIIDGLEKLQDGGLRLRSELVDQLVAKVVEGRGYTYNEQLVTAVEWSGLFDRLKKYKSLKSELDVINKQLNRLRRILLQMEDIDQTGLTNNFDVNLVHAFKSDGGKESAVVEDVLKGVELRKQRREEVREMWDCLEFKVSDKGKMSVDWTHSYSSYEIEIFQRMLLNFGFLSSEKQVTGKVDRVTKNAAVRWISMEQYVGEQLEGAYDPNSVAVFNPNAKMLQKKYVYMGYLDEDDVDGKYHEKTHQRALKLVADMEADEMAEKE